MQTGKRKVSEQAFKAFEKTKHYKQALIQADNELRDKHLRGEFDQGDPNHPKYNNGYNYATGKYVELFGYEQDEFVAKQYK